jgi:hypothetical protein
MRRVRVRIFGGCVVPAALAQLRSAPQDNAAGTDGELAFASTRLAEMLATYPP